MEIAWVKRPETTETVKDVPLDVAFVTRPSGGAVRVFWRRPEGDSDTRRGVFVLGRHGDVFISTLPEDLPVYRVSVDEVQLSLL